MGMNSPVWPPSQRKEPGPYPSPYLALRMHSPEKMWKYIWTCVKTTYYDIIVYAHCLLYCTFTVFSNRITRTATTITIKCSVLFDTTSYIWQEEKENLAFYLSSSNITGFGDWWLLRQGILSFLMSKLSISLRIWWHMDPFPEKRHTHGPSLNTVSEDWLNFNYESQRWIGTQDKILSKLINYFVWWYNWHL